MFSFFRTVFHYRVDFSPAVDETFVRRQLYKPFRKPIAEGGFGISIFDGHSIWMVARITEGIGAPPAVRVSTRDGDPTQYSLTIKMVGQLNPGDPGFIQIYNNITRACLRALKLAPMGRNYFDPRAEVILSQHRLKLWPGFVTTMRQHDRGILYCVELTHKVIRTEDVFSVMKRVRAEANQRGQDHKQAVAKEIVGSIVSF